MAKTGKMVRFSFNGSDYNVYQSQLTELLHGLMKGDIKDGDSKVYPEDLWDSPALLLSVIGSKPVRTGSVHEAETVAELLSLAGANLSPRDRFSFAGQVISRKHVGALQVWAMSDPAQIAERLAYTDWPNAVEAPEAGDSNALSVKSGLDIIRPFM